jgi:hypothetical protein
MLLFVIWTENWVVILSLYYNEFVVRVPSMLCGRTGVGEDSVTELIRAYANSAGDIENWDGEKRSTVSQLYKNPPVARAYYVILQLPPYCAMRTQSLSPLYVPSSQFDCYIRRSRTIHIFILMYSFI